MKMKALSQIALVLTVICLVLLRLTEQIGQDKAPNDRFVIDRIIDGDTVQLRGGDRLRLLAIDAPEKGQPFYEEAASFLAELALGKEAEIKYAGRRRDGYGRLLGYLYIDGQFANRRLLAEGLAYIYLFKDNDLTSAEIGMLLNAQREAISNRIGLWSLERSKEPYYVSKSRSLRLHRPGCRTMGKLIEDRYRVFEERNEGLSEGLSPCRNCAP